MFKLPFGKKPELPKNLLAKDRKPIDGENGSKRERKKKELPKPWTLKDRVIVAAALLLTFALGIYFWYKGQDQVPVGTWFNFKLPNFSFEEKIILQ